MAEKRVIPKQGSGYELGVNRKGYISIIVPEELTKNYIQNPIFAAGKEPYSYFGGESDNWYGYTGVNATPSDNDRALTMKDSYAIKVTPTAYTTPTEYSKAHGIKYSITGLPAGTYTFSAYFSANIGREFVSYAKSDGGTLLSEIKSEFARGIGDFTRIYFTFSISAQTNVDLFLLESEISGSIVPPYFYTSAWMLEDNSYVTSFFSGDSTEKAFFDKGTAYGWYGNKSYSVSYRTLDAYSSGREVNLSDLGFHLDAMVGLGINPMETKISDISSGGGIYDGHTNKTRTFTLVGTVYGRDIQEILDNERKIYDVIRPIGANAYHQPTTMLFRIWDECENTWIGQPIYIYCRYQSGFEGSTISETSEKISLMFVCEDPFFYSAYEERQSLIANSEFEPAPLDSSKQVILHRDMSGDWEMLNIDSTGTPDNFQIYKILKSGADSSLIYFMGVFLDANGVADTQSIFAYNKDTGTVSSIGDVTTIAGVPISYIFDAIFLPNGKLVIAGLFASAGGVANTHDIAIYDTVSGSWNDAGGGIGVATDLGMVFNIELGSDNSIYAIGSFTNAGGVAGADNIAKYNFDTDSWSALGAAKDMPDGSLLGITIIPGTLYGESTPDRVIVCGSFSSIDNVTANTGAIAEWDGTAWKSIGWEFAVGHTVTEVHYSSDGVLYAQISIDAGASYSIYKYTGSAWQKISTSEFVNTTAVFQNIKNTIAFMPSSSAWTATNSFSDIILFTKDFQSFTSEEISYDRTAVTNYGAFLYENPDNLDGELWVAVSKNAHTIYPKRTQIVNNGELCYPTIKITGDCYLNSIKNNTTKKTVMIDGYRILDRSIAKINFGIDIAYSKVFIVNDFENIVNHILEMSDMNFYLSPGNNDVHVFYTAITANATSEIWFRERYASISKATEYIGG